MQFFTKSTVILLLLFACCIDASFSQDKFGNDKYYQQIYEEFENGNDKEKVIEAVCDTSITYLIGNGKNKDLLMYFYQYLEAQQKPIPYKLNLAIGIHYGYSKGEGAILAMDYLLRAVNQPESKNDLFSLTHAYYCLGNLLYNVNDYAEAKKYLIEAEKSLGNTQLVNGGNIGILNTLGLIFLRTNQFSKAESYFQKTIEIATREKESLWIGLAKGNLGTTYYKQKKYKEALSLLYEDVRISVQFSQYSNAVTSICDIIGIYIAIGDSENAKIHLDEAFALLKNLNRESGEKPPFYNIYDIASVYYETQKDYEKAFYYKKESQIAQKEQQDFLKVENLQKIKFKFAEERNLLDISKLTKQKETQSIYLYLVIAILFFMILLAIAIYQRYKEKRKANGLLTRQNQAIQAQKEQIDLQNKNLLSLNQTKNKLFSIIGHDLRSPLVSLKGVLDLLKGGNLSIDELKEIIPFLDNSLESTLNLTDDLLLWGRMQLEGIKVNPQEIDVQDFIAAKANSFIPLAQAKMINIEVEIAQGTAKVYADENMLKAIIRNLVSNAIKFCNEHGKITLSTQNDTEPNFVVFAVTDTGVGIAQENIDKLFSGTAFTTKGTKGESGTGFGLMLCKDFVNLSGGKIWVESKLGKGTTFYFTMPIFEPNY